MKQKSMSAKQKAHNKILKYLKNKEIFSIYKDFKKLLKVGNSYAVAVSGGPDSLALAYFSKCFSLQNKTKFFYFTVDHRLRKDSGLEAKKVSSNLKKFGINCKILTWKGKKPMSNIQSIARYNRYHLIAKECKKNKTKNLLLGHQIEDLYENFFLRLLRGSGLKGLISMDVTSEDSINGIKIFRPLINIEKLKLINVSKKVFNFFIKDPSNTNDVFARIRIRKLINELKREGLDTNKLKLSIKNLKDSDRTIKFYVSRNIEENTIYFENKQNFFLKRNFFYQPNEIVFRSLSNVLNKISKRYYSPRGKSLMELINRIKFKDFKKSTLGGCIVEKINESVLISREKPKKH